ncbi:MAG: hypothetical protein O7C60_00395, partial [Rickettsia endosymbiont of Ixodes persulcatus]|nr:hypothetical protein [Rickettsia endosymbiont of Ixodes persulcatus]
MKNFFLQVRQNEALLSTEFLLKQHTIYIPNWASEARIQIPCVLRDKMRHKTNTEQVRQNEALLSTEFLLKQHTIYIPNWASEA